MAGTTFWVANVIFFVSGPIMVLVNQQLGAHFLARATLPYARRAHCGPAPHG